MRNPDAAADPAPLVDRFADLALEAAGAACAAVFLLDGDRGTLFCQALRVDDGVVMRAPASPEPLAPGDPVLARVLSLHGPVAVANAHTSELLPAAWVDALGLGSAVMAPLQSGGSYLGLLVVGWPEAGPIGEPVVEATRSGARALALALEAVVDDHVELMLATERERLALDLLDALSRVLAAVNLRAGLLRLVVEDDLAEDMRAIESLARRGLAALSRGTASMAALRSDVPDLAGEIQRLARSYEERHPARVLVDMRGAAALPDEVQEALVRVAHEAISNVERHSEARVVSISLDVRQAEAVLRVRDDGLGPWAVHTEGMGVGLALARDALVPLGGTIELREAEPGAELVATVPLVGAPAPVPVR